MVMLAMMPVETKTIEKDNALKIVYPWIVVIVLIACALIILILLDR